MSPTTSLGAKATLMAAWDLVGTHLNFLWFHDGFRTRKATIMIPNKDESEVFMKTFLTVQS